MSIEAFLTAGLFKHDKTGRTIFYPSGPHGRGYSVPDSAAEERIRSKLAWGHIVPIMAGLAGLLAFYARMFDWGAEAWTIAVSTGTVLLVGHLIWLKRLARGMLPAVERMGVAESLRLRSEATPRSLIVAAVCAGIAFEMIIVMAAMMRPMSDVAAAATIFLLANTLVLSIAVLLPLMLRLSFPSLR
jgi:hypothetical protein